MIVNFGRLKKLNHFMPFRSYWVMGKWQRIKYFFNLCYPYSQNVIVNGEKGISINFRKNEFGAKEGTQWCSIKRQPNDYAEIRYQLYIPLEFDFVKGGKLPGLAGGIPLGGGQKSDGFNGFSARYMFKEEGTICLYLYHVNQPTRFGDKFFINNPDGNAFILPKGEWITIKQKVKLNQPNLSDGEIVTSINDKEMQHITGLVFRRTDAIKVDKFFFSCFFGGADPSYAPTQDCSLYFKGIQFE